MGQVTEPFFLFSLKLFMLLSVSVIRVAYCTPIKASQIKVICID